ncbi:A/G-specific adenine glycosylase [Rhodocyclus tenuis]|uniref:Adenine DNA glycosylase n=1 Tax=Rhodocyclus gracilis TaxID=2929842 RepID=A0ABX0WI18_9RHOO|nr:A/G-specific adenine glycosylase [Rhodocyclus gracilis]
MKPPSARLPTAPLPAGVDAGFAERVIDWQRQHGRHDLPWQQRDSARDPYRVWLSEIMLQQTQVATVIPYYLRFLARFPTLDALAAAPLGDVLEHWAGLGYYARARNLHRCAQTLVAEHNGRFPPAAERIAELPGIGRSTAAAIAVFGFGERAAILDGNVKRVFARHFGIEGFTGSPAIERRLWALAEALLPTQGVDAYTQGLMDLGATLCTRGQARCNDCPLAAGCVARREQRQAELPSPRPKKNVPERQTTFLILDDGARVLLERRPASGIWGGLLAPPELVSGGLDDSAPPATDLEAAAISDAERTAASALARRHGCRLRQMEVLPALTHVFSHFRLHIRALRCHVTAPGGGIAEDGWYWLARSAHAHTAEATLARAALPAPIRRLFSALPD